MANEKPKTEDKTLPTCFIIMPLTVYPQFYTTYNQQKDYFEHLLKSVFVPAAHKAEYRPIQPIAEGSQMIHSTIIRHIRESHMVLCDMTCWNPNVFFELGIRTAYNKPVCLVRDDHTDIPFDINPMNCLMYPSNPKFWETNKTIDNLAKQIKEAENTCKKRNPFWNAHGFEITPTASRSVGLDARTVEIINTVLPALYSDVQSLKANSRPQPSFQESARIAKTFEATRRSNVEQCILAILDKDEIEVMFFWEDNKTLTLYVREKTPEELLSKCQVVGSVLGTAVFENVSDVFL